MVHSQWGGLGKDPHGLHPDEPGGGTGPDQRPHRHRHRRGESLHGDGPWSSGRRGGLLSGRRALVGLGVSGAGMAAVALAVAVGIGQMTGGQACAAQLSPSALVEAASSGVGVATHYVLQGPGNCSYPSPPANGLYVALPRAEYISAAACGGYLAVTGPEGSVTVQVVDQCTSCAAGQLDLSDRAFARIAPISAGFIHVSYRYLVNPALPGPITAEVKQGSSRFRLGLLFDNTGNPLASVEVQTPFGWRRLSRASDNYWIATSGAGSGPFTVRLTDTQGHQVTVGGITLSPGVVRRTGTYMYGAGSTATPSPTTPAVGQSATAGSATSASPAGAPPARTAPATSAPTPTATGSGTPAARQQAQAVTVQSSLPGSPSPSDPSAC